MNCAKTGTLPKVCPAALWGSENWGATVVILDANGYNKSYKAAQWCRLHQDPFAGRPLEKSS
jgi:hypothetical protein